MAAQLKLHFIDDKFTRVEHGGSLHRGRRKERRPFSRKKAMHLTLRSSSARGGRSMLHPKHAKFIRALLTALARRWKVRVYGYSNNGNHLHLLLQANRREHFLGFLRAFSGTIALKVAGGKKGSPSSERFWDFIPWTRVLEWGKAYLIAKQYVIQNALEAAGIVAYKPRKWAG
jgi:REP element-mobilizing transposase RayT